jgi:hypothetical protein
VPKAALRAFSRIHLARIHLDGVGPVTHLV